MPADPSRITAGAASAETPRLRADARHNRNRILDAAREAFAARGLEVPMAAIARRAGVGVATLYRRFPTREALITEVFTDQLTGCVSVIDDALADPDPWQGFCLAVEKLCSLQVADRGFTAAFLTKFPDAVDFEQKRVRAERGFADLVRRAQQSGRLRADFDRSDLILLLMANHGITAESTVDKLAASRRLVAYLLQAFRADHAGPACVLPPPASLDLDRVSRSSRIPNLKEPGGP
ncbi:TetR/AcrR family transcriptional regulator [Pseudonocardia asaccharolytica]|uniref:TetR family transcriptional regulator n=1 Tax=Pseudonocardia asaccharolytica DSM 44247 = NBRC 16224 TaxID=1123024 RepID=A0A511D3T0_9PSEU|nr:TetR/AcrR family transcriptional regulator [Pseudonocardia asaccharolytica]GEL17568.1 TetR family transcriptional regulator [Pseudonocardia asaccharolytica DSM 44247 = NBRC 16224]